MTDLDRYGLFALAVVILLILFISMGNMECDEDNEGYESVSLITELPVPEVVEMDETISGSSPTRRDFNFEEGPAPYPGGGEASEEHPSMETARGAYILHKVREGESYSSIAKKYYGSIVYWDSVQHANPGVTPRSLKVGQLIRVPKKPKSLALSGRGGQSATKKTLTSPPIRHKVRKNDTLAGISKHYYGTTRKWRLIYDANRSKISNPDMLTVGADLSIPQ